MKPWIKKINENHALRCNCVLYLRALGVKMPFGLFTIEDKKKIINTKKPAPGNIAIIDTGQKWGHIALITYARGRHVTIREANFYGCQISERHDTPDALHIVGYFQKNKLDKKEKAV
jgi:hypothetical protein